jgi:hypothetical protein
VDRKAAETISAALNTGEANFEPLRLRTKLHRLPYMKKKQARTDVTSE